MWEQFAVLLIKTIDIWDKRQNDVCLCVLWLSLFQQQSVLYVYVHWRHAHKTEDIICHRITLHIFINNQNHIHNHRHTQLSYIMTKEPLIRISQQICFFYLAHNEVSVVSLLPLSLNCACFNKLVVCLHFPVFSVFLVFFVHLLPIYFSWFLRI